MVGSPLCHESTSSSSLKLLCSYDGKILPRHPDGRLRYTGGHTRLLSVPRFITFSELLAKLSELYGSPVSLRCQLPTADLDALVSITSDEDLANLVEEYDKAAPAGAKIRAFLCPIKPKIPSPPGSVCSPPPQRSGRLLPPSGRCVVPSSVASMVRFPPRAEKFACHHHYHRHQWGNTGKNSNHVIALFTRANASDLPPFNSQPKKN